MSPASKQVWQVTQCGRYAHTISFTSVTSSPTAGPKVKKLFELAFGRRPAEELYDLRKDPAQLNNVADHPDYAKVKSKLAADLVAELKATKDPRIIGNGDVFDTYPYYGGMPDSKPAGTNR